MTNKKYWNQHEGPIRAHKNSYDVIACEKCGFTHIIPIPSCEELSDYYRLKFYGEQKIDYCQLQLKQKDWWDFVYLDRLKRLERNCLTNGKRLLDIGSGPGFFLKFAKEQGWDVIGIEPGEKAVAFSLGLGVNTLCGEFDDESAKTIGKVDVIHMQGVLEHLRDPIDTIKTCKSILNPSGLLCFSVANDFNPFQELLVQNNMQEEWWVIPPEHINYFSIKDLDQLFINQGIEVLDKVSSFPMEMFLMMNENYIENKDLGPVCQKKREMIESVLKNKMDFREQLYRSFADLGIGRTVEIIGRIKHE